jgi:hypothetical protein
MCAIFNYALILNSYFSANMYQCQNEISQDSSFSGRAAREQRLTYLTVVVVVEDILAIVCSFVRSPSAIAQEIKRVRPRRRRKAIKV